MIVARVDALGRFLDSEDGANLLAGAKRANNILRIEEKKDGRAYDAGARPALLEQPEEKALAKAVDEVEDRPRRRRSPTRISRRRWAPWRKLRAPVDAFFDHVTVNAEDPKLAREPLCGS